MINRLLAYSATVVLATLIQSHCAIDISVNISIPSGYPLNRENGQKNPCQGEHREFGNFAKTQGNSGKSSKLAQGKFAVRQGKIRKT